MTDADSTSLLSQILASSPSSASEPMKILLIDDDQDCRALVRDAIRTCAPEHRCFEFCDGQAALDFLEQADADSVPNLIFLDIEMPRMDGLSTLERIKQNPRLANIPVVMLTGVADDDYMRRAAALGANSYTVKPARAEHFLSTVQASTIYWLNIHQYPQHHLSQIDARR